MAFDSINLFQQVIPMRIAWLLSIVLIVGFTGCFGPEVIDTSTAAKTPVNKSEPIAIVASTRNVDAPEIAANKSSMAAEVAAPEGEFNFVNSVFEAPVMLMAGDRPMNAGHSYPSPAIIDIDGDGDDEMVLGEIMGTVSFCENENKSGGDPKWSAVSPVLMADRKPLKLNNW